MGDHNDVLGLACSSLGKSWHPQDSIHLRELRFNFYLFVVEVPLICQKLSAEPKSLLVVFLKLCERKCELQSFSGISTIREWVVDD